MFQNNEVFIERFYKQARKRAVIVINFWDKWHNPSLEEIAKGVYEQHPDMQVFERLLGPNYLAIHLQQNITLIRQACFRLANQQSSIKQLLAFVNNNHNLDNLKYHRYGLLNEKYYATENEDPEPRRASLNRTYYKDPITRETAKLFLTGRGKKTHGLWYFDLVNKNYFDSMLLAMVSDASISGGVKVQRSLHLLMHAMLTKKVLDPDVFKTIGEAATISGDYQQYRNMAIQIQEQRAEERRKAEEAAKSDEFVDEQDIDVG